MWYELAYVAGVTNALDTLADGLRLPPEFGSVPRTPLVPLIDVAAAPDDVRKVFEEIRDFYVLDHTPAVFRAMARDAVYLQGYWTATREAFTARTLDRLTKEVLALAASLTGRSEYGIDFHLREARRLGLTEQGLTEVLEVVQCFNTVTKIADALQLAPDFDPGSALER